MFNRKHKVFATVFTMSLAQAAPADWSANLLQDGDGESGDVNAWTVDVRGRLNFPDDSDVRGIKAVQSSSGGSVLPRTGNYLVELGSSGPTVKVHQSIDAGPYAKAIDGGGVQMKSGGWFRSVLSLPRSSNSLYIGSCQYIFQFKDKDKKIIQEEKPFMTNCINLSDWTQNEVVLPVPPSTRTIENVIQISGQADSSLGFLGDDLYFNIDAGTTSEPGTVRGGIAGLTKAAISCQNLASGVLKKGKLGSATSWNCTRLGLEGASGQKVKIVITGKLK